jgi:phosphopantetheinyl transferase
MKQLRLYFNVDEWKPQRHELLRAISGINENELEKLKKFHFKKHFKFSLIGRLLIRYVVKKLINISWNDISLSESSYNKPILKNELNNFDFNVSHDGDLTCIVAYYDNGNNNNKIAVGLDTMKIGPTYLTIDLNSFTDHLTKSEYKQIYESSDQMHTFYRLWCFKEGFIKNIGMGLIFELNRIETKFASPIIQIDEIVQNTEVFVDDKKSIDYDFDEQIVLKNHIITVCKFGIKKEQESSEELIFKEIKIDEILENIIEINVVNELYWLDFTLKPEQAL